MNIQKCFSYPVSVQDRFTARTNQNTTSNTVISKTFQNKNTAEILRNNALASIAFTSNENKIRKARNELKEKFRIKDASVDYHPCVEDTRISTFAETVENILVENNINNKKDVLSVISCVNDISNQAIEEDAKNISHFSSATQLYFGEILRKEFLETLALECSQNCTTEKLDESDIKQLIKSVCKKLFYKHDYDDEIEKRIETQKLCTTDDKIHIKKIELSTDDMDKLKASFNNHKVAKDNYNMKELSEIFINEYVSGNYAMRDLPAHIITACLQTQKRYNSLDKKFRPVPKEPVYRWIWVKDMAKFIENMPAVGEIYSYPKMQSCSKYESYAENQFRDDNPDQSVKFVIHPIAETSQAYDIGERKYGDNEVIYPPNTKFRVLGKEIVSAYKNNTNYATSNNTFYRYVIHLQEVLPENNDVENI